MAQAARNEAALIERVRRGDGEAYFELVSEFRLRLYRKACSMIASPDDAEDVLQEALITAYRAIDKFRGESSFYTWLYRIVINKCRDFYRSAKTRREDNLDPATAIISDERIGQEKNLELSEDASYLIDKINGLDKKYREILVMRYYDDLSYQEIAEVLKINQGTVKSRLFKARELLKRSILGNGRGEEYFNV
jgi:RNA polymerase sigma-70 factor (ECF subfamily)